MSGRAGATTRDVGRRRPARRLLVFGRAPEPGRTKTRLAPLLGEEGAAALYDAFLRDTLDAARGVAGADLELWVPPRPGAEAALRRHHPNVTLRWQSGPDLGARLEVAFASSFSDGADHVLVLGSDHPTLPADRLARGFCALRSAQLVLGPTSDGGYYALALRRGAWPRARELFRGVAWSTPRVLPQTRARAERLGLCRAELPAWYDVDDPADLERLRADLRPGSATARALEGLVPAP